MNKISVNWPTDHDGPEGKRKNAKNERRNERKNRNYKEYTSCVESPKVREKRMSKYKYSWKQERG